MNNIENSIRHLQSNIKKRSVLIWDLQVEVRYHKFFKQVSNRFANSRNELAIEVKQQKIEKKMLAMLYCLQTNKSNSRGWTDKQLAKALDNI